MPEIIRTPAVAETNPVRHMTENRLKVSFEPILFIMRVLLYQLLGRNSSKELIRPIEMDGI
jgi:hypothetical protein